MSQDAAGVQGPAKDPRALEVLRGAARGAVGAMAKTGMRVLTTELGLAEQTPPRRSPPWLRDLLRQAPRRQRRGLSRPPITCSYGLVLSGTHRNKRDQPSGLRKR